MLLPSTSKRAWWHLRELCFNLANRGLHLKHFLIEILQKAELGPNYAKNSLLPNKKKKVTTSQSWTNRFKTSTDGPMCLLSLITDIYITCQNTAEYSDSQCWNALSGSCRFITSWNKVYFLLEWVTVLLNHLTLLLCLFSAQSLILKMPFNKEFFLILATYGSSCLQFLFIKWVTSSFKQDSFLFCC